MVMLAISWKIKINDEFLAYTGFTDYQGVVFFKSVFKMFGPTRVQKLA